MGLGARKTRTKLSQDPNNTSWSKSTDGFGYRVLSKQGWKPGDFLGVENAEHSVHYTAANASHIKVLLREENLGLGAKIGKNNADTFGLGLFSGVLSRLNGKSDDEIEKQKHSLRDAELRHYQAQKFGYMNFVRGGLLIGDKIEPAGNHNGQKLKAEAQKENVTRNSNALESGEAIVGSNQKTEQKHRETLTTTTSTSTEERQDGTNTATRDTSNSESLSEETSDSGERSQKREKRKTLKRALPIEETITKSSARTDRGESTAERRARKADRRRRKEEKRQRRAELQALGATSSKDSTESAPKPNAAFAGNRHAVRHRYIQHKRQAVSNAQAMKEIFMLNAAA